MKQSKFLKEHKKNLKKLNKKQLIVQVLNLIKINTQQSIRESDLEDNFNRMEQSRDEADKESFRYAKQIAHKDKLLTALI